MQKDKEKNKWSIIEDRQRKKVEESQEESRRQRKSQKQKEKVPINKENQMRKIEDNKKESRRQTKKETEEERENRGYVKKDRIKDRKQRTGNVEHMKRNRHKGVGSEKTTIKKYMFHLENR